MADEEPKIPVFSVLKNGVILKNIFIVNNPSASPADDTDRTSEVIFNVGRHHDCHILLTHPSISRFHLRIYSNPSSQKLSVMDLSSVHGTWVNYTKIEPGIRVELNEGDTLGVGGSSRIYKLQWVPMNQAYDTKCSFMSSLIEEKEEETAENMEGMSAQDDQVENEEYLKQKSIREEVGSNVLPIDEETVGAYWGDLLNIGYGDYGGYKFPSEDVDLEILACGEGEVMETAQTREVTENQVEPGEYEYRDTLEENGRGIVAIDEDKEETAKVEGETMKAYWDDLLKIDYEQFGEHKYPLEEMVEESELMETAKVVEIVTADQIVNGEFVEYKDQLEQSNEHIPAGGEDATEASQLGDLLQTVNEEEVNEEINQGILESNSEGLGSPVLNESCGLLVREEKGILESNSEVASLDTTFEGLGSPVLNESCGLLVREETPMRLPVPQRMDSSSSDEDVTEVSAESNTKVGENCIACSEFAFSECMTFSLPPVILLEADVLKSDKEETLGVGIATEYAFDAAEKNLGPQNEDSRSCLPNEINGEFDSKSYEAENSSSEYSRLESSLLILPKVVAATKCEITGAENPMLVPSDASESKLVPKIDSQSDSKTKQSADTIESTDKFLEGQGNHSSFKADEQGEQKNIKVEENDESSIYLEDPAADSLLLNDENKTLLFSFSRRQIPFVESSTPRLWSRIGKPDTVVQLQTDKRSRKRRSMSLNANDRQQNRENDESIFVVRDLTAELDRAEEEILDPVKENMTPNMLKLRFKKEIGKLGLVESPSGQLNSFQTKEDVFNSLDEEHQTPVEENFLGQDEQVSTFIPKFLIEEDVLNSSPEEKQTPKSSPRSVIPEVNERARSCFRSSQVESELSTVAKVSSGKKPWIMVADTSSFLDKESRKSLQLLQGLQGTQLIIPLTVMRELDSLKNKSSLFGRNTEAASALEWIEKTQIAPTAEDCVLDYALVYRTNTNAHTVLLTNDISLKIEAMAEGLLCETPQEFRSSLVNPFSDRFMWAGSSPRGQTWSCLDDVGLKEWYLGCQAYRNGAKGLKLLLPCNAKWYY